MSKYMEKDGDYLNGKAHYHVDRIYVRGTGMRRIYRYTYLSDDFPLFSETFGPGKTIVCTSIADLFYDDCRKIAQGLSTADTLTEEEKDTSVWLTTLAGDALKASENFTWEIRRNFLYGVLLTLFLVKVYDADAPAETIDKAFSDESTAPTCLGVYKEFPLLTFIDNGDGYGYFHKKGESVRSYLPPAYLPDPDKIGFFAESLATNPLAKSLLDFLLYRYSSRASHKNWWSSLDVNAVLDKTHVSASDLMPVKGRITGLKGRKIQIVTEDASDFHFTVKRTELVLDLSVIELDVPYFFERFFTKTDGRPVVYGEEMSALIEMIEEPLDLYIVHYNHTSTHCDIAVHIPGVAVTYDNRTEYLHGLIRIERKKS